MHYFFTGNKQASFKQKGFTLVELIVVIVILGILAATALPKFINVTEDANIAAANGLAGGLRSAASLVQARFMASGMSAAGNVAMAAGGGNVAATANGFPTATAAGIVAAMQSIEGFNVAHNAGVSTFSLTNTATCAVTYTEATGVVSTAAVNAASC